LKEKVVKREKKGRGRVWHEGDIKIGIEKKGGSLIEGGEGGGRRLSAPGGVERRGARGGAKA